VYYSTTWWRTQHPSRIIGTGNLDPSMWPPVLWNLAAWLAWGLMLLAARFRLERRRQRREQDEALRALEASLEAAPWKEGE
jgi:heme exporter protein C